MGMAQTGGNRLAANPRPGESAADNAELATVAFTYFDFLYLDARYRLADSTTSGSPTSKASLTLTARLSVGS